MHRTDIARATGADLVLTAEHSGVLVAGWAAGQASPMRCT
jgi:hypothetical protein